MKVTRDVIRDLLPLYQAGEASRDTRDLIEAFLSGDPALAAEARDSQAAATFPEPPAGAMSNGRAALEYTRRLIGRRQRFFGAALACTLLPFSIAVRHGEVVWFMWRDAPDLAGVLTGVAVGCWIGYFRARRQLSVAGM